MWATLLLQLPLDEFLRRWYDQSVFNQFKPDFKLRREHNIQEVAKALMHFNLAHQNHYEIDEVLVGIHDQKFCDLFSNPIVILHAAHMVHLENPQAVAEIIKKRAGI